MGAPYWLEAAARTFVRRGGSWEPESRLDTSAAYLPGDVFGPLDTAPLSSVAIDGDLVVIGSLQDGLDFTGNGVAWVFERSAGTWAERGVLRPDPPSPPVDLAHFGESVAVRGSRILVGAPQRDVPVGGLHGIAFLFASDAGLPLLGVLGDDGESATRYLGTSVALGGDGSFAVVGSRSALTGSGAVGQAYFYDVE